MTFGYGSDYRYRNRYQNNPLEHAIAAAMAAK
jgi:hypothetical protein